MHAFDWLRVMNGSWYSCEIIFKWPDVVLSRFLPVLSSDGSLLLGAAVKSRSASTLDSVIDGRSEELPRKLDFGAEE